MYGYLSWWTQNRYLSSLTEIVGMSGHASARVGWGTACSSDRQLGTVAFGGSYMPSSVGPRPNTRTKERRDSGVRVVGQVYSRAVQWIKKAYRCCNWAGNEPEAYSACHDPTGARSLLTPRELSWRWGCHGREQRHGWPVL